QVEPAVSVPVHGEGRGGGADVNVVSIAILQRLPSREGAVGVAAEVVDVTRPRAGDDVRPAVPVQVHQLWREAATSALGHAARAAACREPGERLEPRPDSRSLVAVDAEPALVELPDQEVGHAV